MKKITLVSRILQIVFWIALVCLPILTVLFWVYFEDLMAFGFSDRVGNINLTSLPLQLPLSLSTRLFAMAASVLPLAINMVVVYLLIRLFRLYARGSIFTADNVRFIRWIGYMILIGQAISPVYQALLSLALTVGNPPGQRMISIGADNQNLFAIVSAVIIILVAWIMDEGRRLQEEQALVI
jgi:hypothetical protein